MAARTYWYVKERRLELYGSFPLSGDAALCYARLVIRFSVLVLALFLSAHLHAAVVTFEDLPDANFFSDADVDIGSFYSGITFSPDVTGLSVTRFGGYDDSGFPPHSGDVVVWNPVDFDTTITFAAPETSVGLWYTSLDFLTLTAYDAGNTVLGSATGNPNTDGSTGTSSFVSVDAPGITSVVLSGSPGFFVFDDVTYQAATQTSVPEPSSLALISIAAALFLMTRWRLKNIRL